MLIYVIRHGLSEGNAAGVIQGFADSPLTDIGRSQAKLLGRFLRRENVSADTIYSSPLKRALETAEIIADELDPIPAVRPVGGFMEVDVGTLSGMSLEDAHAKYPNGWAGDINKWLDFRIAGGEDFDGFFARVREAADEIIESWGDPLADRAFMFVTHAGVMRPLLKSLLNGEGDFMYFTFGNCCHVKIEYRDIRGGVRRVLSELIRIERVAGLMGEKVPGSDIEDPVSRKMG